MNKYGNNDQHWVKTEIKTCPPQYEDDDSRSTNEGWRGQRLEIPKSAEAKQVYYGDLLTDLGGNETPEVEYSGKYPHGDSITVDDFLNRNRKTNPDRQSCGIDSAIYEPRKVIAAWKLNFNIGSAVKYLAGYLTSINSIDDLIQAKQYIDFEIDELRKNSCKDESM